MALKTGYKVNGKEIILEDFSDKIYSNFNVEKKETYMYSLNDYYKIKNSTIKAAKYVTTSAQLPGEYYKTPSLPGFNGFAEYGTCVVGNDDLHEKTWTEGGFIYVKFFQYNGKCILGQVQQDGTLKEIIREYEADIDTIYIWCMMVASGGGGGIYNPHSGSGLYVGGGGGGASGIIHIKLEKNEMLKVLIGEVTPPEQIGGNSVLDIVRTSGTSEEVLVLHGGYAGKRSTNSLHSYGDGGKVVTTHEDVEGVLYIQTVAGGNGGRGDTSRYNGADGKLYRYYGLKTDYSYIVSQYSITYGGKGEYEPSSSGLYGGGGGGSAFFGGDGASSHDKGADYLMPKCGGGGASASYANSVSNQAGYGGAGAFWLLYA